MKPFPLTTCSGAEEGKEVKDSEEPSVEMLSLDPVEPIDPRLPVTDKMLAEFKQGSSKGGRFPFQIREANHEQ